MTIHPTTIARILHPVRRRKLKRYVRETLPIAIKNGPRSFEWDCVSRRSLELRTTFGE